VEAYYKDEGRGPAILMVYGSVSTLRTYDGVVAALTDRYRIIRLNIPPGRLSGSVSDEAAARLAPVDIAEGLLSALDVKSVVVVGVSSGGTLGVQLAAKRPDLVTRLTLANTPADLVDTSHLNQPQGFLAEQKEAARTHFQSQAFWNEYLVYFSGRPDRNTPAVRRVYYDSNRRVQEAHALGLVAKLADHAAAVRAMERVTAPTLLVWGAKDPLLTGAQVSLVFMPDVGHYPPLESPARFARILSDCVEIIAPLEPRFWESAKRGALTVRLRRSASPAKTEALLESHVVVGQHGLALRKALFGRNALSFGVQNVDQARGAGGVAVAGQLRGAGR
jgi:pimeloyl-ACP methyl ester carboxylesterase